MKRESIFKLDYDDFTMKDTLYEIKKIVERDSGEAQYRADINVGTIVSAQKNVLIKKYINDADIINVDGAGAVLAVRLLNSKSVPRVTGVDLFYSLMELGSKECYRVFLFGATEEVLRVCSDTIENKYPGIKVVGRQNGYYAQGQEVSIVEKINASRADFLFIGNKSPEKEEFVLLWKGHLNSRVIIPVGGAFDVFSGKVRRAPRLWQTLYLEWLFRVMQEPRRMFKRYMVSNLKFLWMLIKECLNVRLK
ncbi:WecB/TagA/CpsF family glycosyltransferase [Pseudomonadales bacterium]|nr:WecB/TagA/CpsF family glycosyltransferase [Pseudomonadales bacterium]